MKKYLNKIETNHNILLGKPLLIGTRLIDILKEVFLKRKTELIGKFTTISVNKIRIRVI